AAGAGFDRAVFIKDGFVEMNVVYQNWTAPYGVSGKNDGNWHHTALTCQSGVGCTFYVDGVLSSPLRSWNDRSQMAPGGKLSQGTDQMEFVTGWAQGPGFLDGQID